MYGLGQKVKGKGEKSQKDETHKQTYLFTKTSLEFPVPIIIDFSWLELCV